MGRFLIVVVVSSCCLTLAQTPASPPPARVVFNLDAVPRPPVPVDLLEIVNGAQPVQDAQQRLGAIDLLKKAQEQSNVRAQPYDLKTSFVSSGGLGSDGNWTLEDTAAGHVYRWTAQGPNYSVVNLYPDGTRGILYSNQADGLLPLRLSQVRDALFFKYQMPGPQASLRTATAFLNGVEQRCVLVVIGAGTRQFSGGRNWQESEYCTDAKTGLLTTYSPVPGLFVHYDYSSAQTFHGKIIPGSFVVTEAGRKVIEARTVSVADPPDPKEPIFSPANLTAKGVGRAMNPPTNVHISTNVPGQPFPQSNVNAAIQVVLLHGNVSADGRLSEAEILASTDASLNQTALDRAGMMKIGSPQNQPGSTPQSREMFYTFEFVTQAR